jgi:dATP pyrophosphohydrolase
MLAMSACKRPVSILALIHTSDLEVLLLERASHAAYWQSVTGSLEEDETPIEAAHREVAEETGILATPDAFLDWHIVNTFEIFAEWRHRYAPDVTHNSEHVFSLELRQKQSVRLSPREHMNYVWLPWREAAARCFSWSNREAILMLPEKRAR